MNLGNILQQYILTKELSQYGFTKQFETTKSVNYIWLIM